MIPRVAAALSVSLLTVYKKLLKKILKVSTEIYLCMKLEAYQERQTDTEQDNDPVNNI